MWFPFAGPIWHVPPNTDLSNCAPGEAPGGTLLVGVRHHTGGEAFAPPQWGGGARPFAWSASSTFRIQITHQIMNSASWATPITIYATHDREHAAWEPTFFRSVDGTVLRVAYSLERPANWSPPACQPRTNYPGADLAAAAPAPSAALCQGRCVGVPDCIAWSWRRADSMCWLKGANHSIVADIALDSGTKLCGADERTAEHFESRQATAAPVLAAESVMAAREQDIVMQESHDSGHTFGPVHVLSRTAGSRDGMPSVVRQPDGCLTIVYEGFGGTTWGRFTVNAIRSCDDGVSWRHTSVFPKGGTGAAHAPTIAILADGRGAVASYDTNHAAQLQISSGPLTGDGDSVWGSPRVVVDSPAAWPNIFTLCDQLWIAFGRGGNSHVAAVNTSDAVVKSQVNHFWNDAVPSVMKSSPRAAHVRVLKGIGSTSGGACDDLGATNTTWWYNWSPTAGVCEQFRGHVPMVWGRDDIAKLATVDRQADALLGFNEPDNCGGQAVALV